MKLKAGIALLPLLPLLFAAPAFAAVWQGTVTAAETMEIRAGADGILERLDLRVGQRVSEGETVGEIKKTLAFSPVDGTVTAVYAREGEEPDGGLVLTIEPTPLYTVYCSVKKAKRSIANTLVHGGDRVWIRCSQDGSHRAMGRIILVDGDEYRVEVTGGDLCVGEAVFVYREGSFSDADLIGTGTVLQTAAVKSTADGVVLSLAVSAGEKVERGQLLYTTASTERTDITSRVSGWVTALGKAEGSSVKEEGTVAKVATEVRITVTTDLSDRTALRAGTELRCWRADDPHHLIPCRVVRVLTHTGSEEMTAELVPLDGELLPLGMTIGVTNEKE